MLIKRVIVSFLIVISAGAFGAEHLYFRDGQVPKVSPEKLNDWDISKAFRKKSGERTEISLNGFWKFCLCEKKQETPPPFSDEWGYFLVPGFWKTGPQCNFFRTADGKAVEKVRGKSYNAYHQGWYYREFATPAECADRQTFLKFDAFYSEGILLINGKRVPLPDLTTGPSRRTPAFQIDITEYLRPAGEKNAIAIATSSVPKGDFLRAGLQDNVWLCTRPKQNFGQPRIFTFVKNKKLQIEFRNAALPENFTGTVELTVRNNVDGESIHSAVVPYASKIELDYITPELWSLDKPTLYRLDCKLVQDGKTVDAVSIRFGFRELTVDKGRFLLNGEPIMINTDSSWQGLWAPLWYTTDSMTRRFIRTMKKFGINAAYTQRMNAASFYEIADEEGFLCVEMVALSYDEFNKNTAEQCAGIWRSLAEKHVDSARLDNHPSVAAILINIYYQMSASANNPAYIGMSRHAAQHRHIQPDGTEKITGGGDPNLTGDPKVRSDKLNLVADQVKDFFPDAEVLTGASGHVKNAYGVHIYHTWGAPFAELAALFSNYSKERAVPVYCGEYAIPYHGSYAHLNLWGQIRNKPEFYYWQENAARILGPAAYREKSVTTTFAWDGAHNNLLASNRGFDGLDRWTEYYFIADIYSKILEHSINRTIFYWRYDGLAGLAPFEYITGRYLTGARSLPGASPLPADLTQPGVKPDVLYGSHILPPFDPRGKELDLRPNPVSTPFRQAMEKTVCKIVGAGKDYYENDHAYWSGETLSKALAVVNMDGKFQKWNVEITLLDGSGSAAAAVKVPFQIDAYTQKTIPFQLQMPNVGTRREYTLKAVFHPVSDGAGKLTAAFPVQVFPKAAPAIREIQVFGGTPEFLLSLEKQGYLISTVKAWEDVVPEKVLVIAPGALSGIEIPDFSAMTQKGIRTLVMEQKTNTSTELIKIRCRNAFINAPSHPVLEGFADADFSEWRGSYSLDPAYGNAKPGHVWSNAAWTDWGNRGMVAGNVFRRPYTGNYLSLLVSGFDLYQTPLMEFRGENTSWIASQLEIGKRIGLDPVATTLFGRMVDYLAERRPVTGKVGLFGGEKGEVFLKKFGVRYQKSDLSDLNDYRLLIVSDPDWKMLAKYSFELSDYVYNGGKVLYIHTGKTWAGTWLPFIMEMKQSQMKEKGLIGSGKGANWLEGWGASELYWRGKPTLPAFLKYPELAAATAPAVLVQVKHGCGSYTFSSVTPENFGNEQMAAAKYGRLLSALFTSLGAVMENSAAPYKNNLSLTLPLRFMKWEFALDPENKGLEEGRQSGRDGSGKWLSGQQTIIGESVRPGVGYEQFLERQYKGVCWYRVRFTLSPEQVKAKKMRAELGRINTKDRTFLNGKQIGNSSRGKRSYRIPDGLLKAGENILVIRIENQRVPGGLLEPEIKLSNSETMGPFWKRLYPGGNRDYSYNPDWIRQY
ncbi:MAG: hypothetical protein IJZ19_14015 [Lentisphaeria bacterium]|nr:hypothetical protein [Lentisphaeria bacterium]